MKVEVKRLLDFLLNGDKPFSIPLFQRPYSWDEWQCVEMWNDIERIGGSDDPHFFGAMFHRTERDENGNEIVSLIDGQQRTLTTLLLLEALSEALESIRPQAPIDALEATKGLEGRLATPKADENRTVFRELADRPDFDAARFEKGLRNLEIVAVELEEDDDAQAIFESFNSKGVPLVAADMVRNYLLLTESPEEQERLYLEYWEPLQGLFGDDPVSLRLNNALRAWTVIRCKTPKSKSDSECFDDFKHYLLDEYDGSNEDLIDELLSFCKIWAQNYRYHEVKKFRSANWAKIGRKTLVSGRPRKKASKEAMQFYADHYGIDFSQSE